MDNQEKRTRVLGLRKNIPADQILKNSIDVVELLSEEFVSRGLIKEQSTDAVGKDAVSGECDKSDGRKVLCFYPLTGEVDLRRLYDELLTAGAELYFPKTNPNDCSMEFYRVDSLKDFSEGQYGVMEPVYVDEGRKYQGNTGCFNVENTVNKESFTGDKERLEDNKDIIICPGVIFDKNGNRGGFGKGYYDRYLMRYDLTKIAVAFEFQVYDEINTNEWDVPMDMLVTERNVYRWK